MEAPATSAQPSLTEPASTEPSAAPTVALVVTATEAPQAVPADWQTYVDTVYDYELHYPLGWAVQGTPSQGMGGVARLEGEHAGEMLYMDLGKHFSPLQTGESLREYEVRRTEGGGMEPPEVVSEAPVQLGERDAYRQTIRLRAGSGDKEYGIYYLFAGGPDVYFAEAYVVDPEAHLPLIEQILGTIQFQ